MGGGGGKPRCVREAVRFSTTPTLAAVSNAWPQRGGMRLTGRPRRPAGERERGREPGDSFEWVAFQICSEQRRGRHSQHPRALCATGWPASETCRGNSAERCVRPIAGASNAREPRPRRSAGGARTVRQRRRAAPTGSRRRNPRSCVRTPFVIGTVRPQRMETCQAADPSRRACSRPRALQESRPERPQPMETEASRALRRKSI